MKKEYYERPSLTLISLCNEGAVCAVSDNTEPVIDDDI